MVTVVVVVVVEVVEVVVVVVESGRKTMITPEESVFKLLNEH